MNIKQRGISVAIMVIGAFFCARVQAGVVVQTWDLRTGTGDPVFAGAVFTTATFSDPILRGVGAEDVLVDTFKWAPKDISYIRPPSTLPAGLSNKRFRLWLASLTQSNLIR